MFLWFAVAPLPSSSALGLYLLLQSALPHPSLLGFSLAQPDPELSPLSHYTSLSHGSFFFFLKYLLISLAVLGFGCGMQDLCCNLWDLSSTTRDQTQASCIGNSESSPVTTREFPPMVLFCTRDLTSIFSFCVNGQLLLNGLPLLSILVFI